MSDDDHDHEEEEGEVSMSSKQKRLLALRLKFNAIRRANKKGVIEEEQKRTSDPYAENQRAKEEEERQPTMTNTKVRHSIEETSVKLRKKNQKDKHVAPFYNGYEKRLTKLPSNEKKDVEELEEWDQARKKFSRRRQQYDGKDVDYINDRNQHFNKKIARRRRQHYDEKDVDYYQKPPFQ